MRIIGGEHKGKRISVPSSFRARPTTDFAREGLFNVLANTWDFDGLAVLDLFAGTGSIGFEFASRAAGSVHMVEAQVRSARFIQRTAESLGTDKVKVFRTDAMKYLVNCIHRYDIVFADPPYSLEIIAEIPDAVYDAEVLEDEGWFILEHGNTHSFSSHPRFMELRKYGSVHFSFFQ